MIGQLVHDAEAVKLNGDSSQPGERTMAHDRDTLAPRRTS
jgi:hypothetical protein